jgi:translation initiation factor IF-3
MAHQELGHALMQRIKQDLSSMAVAEMEPKLMGRTINMTLSPLPQAKRKRRFEPPDEDYVEDVEHEAEHEVEEKAEHADGADGA